MGHYGAPCPQVDPALLPSQAPAQPHQRRRRFSAEPHRGAAALRGALRATGGGRIERLGRDQGGKGAPRGVCIDGRFLMGMMTFRNTF